MLELGFPKSQLILTLISVTMDEYHELSI